MGCVVGIGEGVSDTQFVTYFRAKKNRKNLQLSTYTYYPRVLPLVLIFKSIIYYYIYTFKIDCMIIILVQTGV